MRPVQPEPSRRSSSGLRRCRRPVLAAAGGFLAGVASFVLFRMRPSQRKLRVGRRRGKKVEIAESRSFLVDIHLLKR